MDRVPVIIHANDPVSHTGITGQLRHRPELRLVDQDDQTATVAVVVVDALDDAAVDLLRRLRMTSRAKVVLVVANIDDHGLGTAVEFGVVGVVRRSEATSEQLTAAITAAVRGEGRLPADLLGRLLEQVGRLQRETLDPRGLTMQGLTSREAQVLRLIAEGRETREIAAELSYSERTVKNVLHGLTTRLHLRNRTHAVAYALRQGLI